MFTYNLSLNNVTDFNIIHSHLIANNLGMTLFLSSSSHCVGLYKEESELTSVNEPLLKQVANISSSIAIFGDDNSAELDADKLQKIAQSLYEQNVESAYVQVNKPAPHCNSGLLLSFSLTLEEVKAIATKLSEQIGVTAVAFSNVPTLDEPGLLVMDMDSTAIKIECIDEIAILAGVGEQVSAVTAAAMRGELDFSQSLRQRVGALKGANESVLQTVLNELPLMEGLESLVSELKKHDWRIAIASGGFTYFADALKDKLALDAAVSNTLTIENGQLTGEVTGRIIDANVKAETVNALANQYAIPSSQTVAMGDGANDLVMMEASALGAAFHAKPKVQAQADIAISTGGLDQLLYVLNAPSLIKLHTVEGVQS